MTDNTICSVFNNKSDYFSGGYLGKSDLHSIQNFIDIFSHGIIIKRDDCILPEKMYYSEGMVKFKSFMCKKTYNIRDLICSNRVGSDVIVEFRSNIRGKGKHMIIKFQSVTDAITVNDAFYVFSQGI